MKNSWQLDPFYFAPLPKLGGGWVAFKDSPSPPPTPDYAAIAKQQGAENIAAARFNAKISNPDINSPLGTQRVTYGGGPPVFNQSAYDAAMKAYQAAQAAPSMGVSSGGNISGMDGLGDFFNGGSGGQSSGKAPNQADYWQTTGDPDKATVDIALSPEQQKLYDQQIRLSNAYGDIGEQGLVRISNAFNTPLDESSINDLQDRAYAAQTSRLDPQWQQADSQQQTALRNQGLVPGGEAYDNAMRVFNQGKNDAYTQARLAASSQAPSLLQQELAIRNQPLTEVNALRTGSQPQMPQFQQYTGSSAAPAPVMQGALAQSQYNQNAYNQQQGASNSATSGLFSLGGSVLGGMFGGPMGASVGGALGSAISDIRLKSNIKRIGTHPLGVGIYEYDIFGHREIGVMAQEVLAVKPKAVIHHPAGFLMVNYGAL